MEQIKATGGHKLSPFQREWNLGAPLKTNLDVLIADKFVNERGSKTTVSHRYTKPTGSRWQVLWAQ